MTKANILIIAEAGINHNGKLKNAKKLINIAKNSGADFVKFQIFNTKHFINKKIFNKKINFKKVYNRFSNLEFSFKEWQALIDYANRKKIKIFFSIFDEQSLILLTKLGINIVKIPSGEITNITLLKLVNKFKFKTILSTGMSTLGEIKSAIRLLKNCTVEVLHCVSEYPTINANLSKINYLKKKLKKNIGFSDHTTCIITPALAVISGAHIIEKHFTFDKKQKVGDHKISLNQSELSEMIKYIRIAEKSRNNFKDKPSLKERSLKMLARKGVYYSKNLKAGDIINIKSLKFLRPLNGSLPSENFQYIINKKLKKNVKELAAVKKEHFF